MGFEHVPLTDVPDDQLRDVRDALERGEVPPWLRASGIGSGKDATDHLRDVRAFGPPAVARFSILESAPGAVHQGVEAWTPPDHLPTEGMFFRGFEAIVSVTSDGDIDEVELAGVYQD